MERFEHKVVVVTGAASGLGKATALAFAARGATLALCDVNAQGLADTAAEIAEVSVAPFVRTVDLADPGACKGFITEVATSLGGIDVLVNVAGVLGFTHVADVT